MRGQGDAATWDRTALAWDELGRPAPAAYARYRVAEAVLSTRGDRAIAAAMLRRAYRAAADLGAKPLGAEIERLARHARIVLGAPGAAAATEPSEAFGLTDREREVLALVGRGLSNAEIAERLYVSPATAKTHVSHIMTKLYARDRAQLVVLAYESGLVRPGM